MTLKDAIVSVLSRDRLRDIAEDLGLEGVDVRSSTRLRAALLRARRAKTSRLLEYLTEREVKQVCEKLGVPTRGRRGALISLLLSGQYPPKLGESFDDAPAQETAVIDGGGQPEPKTLDAPSEPVTTIPVTRTELIWPGKYGADGSRKGVPNIDLPFQVIERVRVSRAIHEARAAPQISLFDIYEGNEGATFDDGWTNKLIWGDNRLVMASLLKTFRGRVELIYIDPPFATGADFSFRAAVGDADLEITKEASVIEEKAYRDTWGRGAASYLSMLSDRFGLMRDLLSEDGAIYVHVGAEVCHLVKLALDDVFGLKRYRAQIIWHYRRWTNVSDNYQQMHDVLLYYTKSAKPVFNKIEIAPTESQQAVIDKGYNVNKVPGKGGKVLQLLVYDREKVEQLVAAGKLDLSKYGRVVYRETGLTAANDVWTDIQYLHSQAIERTGYETQKPEELVRRILEISSNPGALVADFFSGSGTTLAAAEKMGRRWIGCDLSRYAIHVTRKRLLEVPQCRPFDVLNLGRYERQFWQVTTFGRKAGREGEITLYEYLAFILKLYGASPVSGLAHLHGKRGRAMVHIGAVDGPVTIDEIDRALHECVQMRQTELHVLGWEWEMGLGGPNNDYRHGGLLHEIARSKGVKLILLQIPREVMDEQAVTRGDVQFFELAYVDVGIEAQKGSVTVKLRDFVVPNTDLIPDDIREKVRKWSDYIDYWAVDWDFRNDAFMQGWVTYRTRQDRQLRLTSGSHPYEEPGNYRILVKVIDIFGNDTSQAYDLEVS